MNTNTLYLLLEDLWAENKELNIASLVDNLITHFTQSIQNPNADTAKAFEASYSSLKENMLKCKINNKSQVKLKTLKQINGYHLIGDGLLESVSDALTNSDTPASSLKKLQDLSQEIKKFFSNVSTVLNSFKELNLRASGIEDDNAEVEIYIPCKIINNEFGKLSKEIKLLDRAVCDIEEVLSTKRTPIKIVNFSSGSVEINLVINPVTGAAIIVFVTAIVNLVNSIIQSRIASASLKQMTAPKSVLDGIKKWEEELVGKEIQELKKDLLKKYKGDNQRKNELGNSLSKSLHYLADRIDKGMDIDVNIAGELEEDTEEESANKDKSPKMQILRNRGVIKKIERSEESILQLPESSYDIDK